MTDDRTRTRREPVQEETSGLLYAAVDDDVTRPIVLGIGGTPTDARADAALWLGDANDGVLATLKIHPITDTEAAIVRAGDRTWPVRLRAREPNYPAAG